MKPRLSMLLSLAVCGSIVTAATMWWNDQAYGQGGALIAPGLVLPRMNPKHGKELFASKGCVVCHQVNGIGGTDAASLDASTMEPAMSPFDFFAKMWGGAEPMIEMQKDELGHQLDFTGQDLADIIAFVHNRATRRTFSEKDIPENIKAIMEEAEEEGHGEGMGMEPGGGMMDSGR